ncbi:MAG: DUF3054 domain-containing protein [Halobacterium sp.]
MNLVDVDGRAVVRFLPVDLLAVFAFVLLGMLQHGSLTAQRYAGVLVPFLVGWLVVAPLAAAYGERAFESTRGALVVGLASWLGADFLAQVLRATEYFPGSADPQFFVVAFVFGGALLSVARFGTLVVVDLTEQ